jgi:tetratricopeptide (TPR) repeat protein
MAASCQQAVTFAAIDQMSAAQLISASQKAATKAERTSNKKTKRYWATRGKGYANRCIEIKPGEAGCYYWRAVNTGLYYQARVIGYQKGIKQMLVDCEKIIELGQPQYDKAGPYRIQGEIYSRLPQTAGHPDSVIRDLDKAEELLQEAVKLAPNYPENRIALARTLYMLDRFPEAMEQLVLAKEQVPEWRNLDSSYSEWKKTIAKLMKKIERKQN